MATKRRQEARKKLIYFRGNDVVFKLLEDEGGLVGWACQNLAWRKEMKKSEMDELCDQVRNCSYGLHRFLRHGHLEKVYENGLRNRLSKAGIQCRQQIPIPVCDEDGTLLGDLKADLLIQDELIVELKASETVTSAYIAQLLGYLRASRKRYGLLINFGAPKLYIKRFVLDPV